MEPLENRYRTIKAMERTHASIVYKAHDTFLDEVVVVKKLIIPDGEQEYEGELRKRAKREFDLLTSIDHDNVVKAVDFIQDGESTLLVLEYVPGLSIDKILSQGEDSFSLNDKLQVFVQAARGLKVINDSGVAHRDIKPGNIVIEDETKRTVVLDLGIGKSFSKDYSNITKDDTVLGTVAYMSPEQVYGEATVNSDTFSLGLTMYQMFLWVVDSPFYDYDIENAIQKVLQYNPPLLIEALDEKIIATAPHKYAKMSDLISKMLNKEEEDRVRIDHVVDTLEKILAQG